MKPSILFGILNTIVSNEKVSAAHLAEKYEISQRTVYRYVDTLCESGVPIYAVQGKYGGFSITESYKIYASYFTEEEYQRLLPAVASFDIQDETTKSIQDKLSGLSKSVQSNYVLTSDQLVVEAPATAQIQTKLKLLTRAVSQRKVCEITYHDRKGESTKRKIQPLSLVFREGLWYIYSLCLMRNSFRFFRISRIISLDVSDVSFVPPPFSVTDTDFMISEVTENTAVGFTFTAKVLSDVEEWLGLDAVNVHDGQYSAYATLPFDNWLISKLLSFGKDITVIESGELKKAVEKALKSALDNYK